MRKTYMAVEIGGTKLQLAIGTAQGDILMRVRGTTAEGARDGKVTGQTIMAWLENNVPKFLQEAGDGKMYPSAIGVGFGGPIDSNRQRIIQSVQVPGWDGIALAEWFKKKFGMPTRIYNDSSAAGWGEYRIGSGKGKKLFFYTNMGTGIGGCLILNGELFDGQGYGGAEFGQMRVPDFTSSEAHADCKLESLCAGAAVQQRIRQAGYVPEGSWLYAVCGGRVNELTGREFGMAVAREDPWALQELDRVADTMGLALANLINICFPERIAIGGGFSMIGEPLISRLRVATEKRVFISARDRYDIVQCVQGEDIVLNGALLLAAHDLG